MRPYQPTGRAVEKLVEDAKDKYAAVAGGSDSVWEKLRNPISSPEITDDRCFAGCWNNLKFCLWGRGVELVINQYMLALTGQIKIYASLLADVGVRYPNAFAVTAAVT